MPVTTQINVHAKLDEFDMCVVDRARGVHCVREMANQLKTSQKTIRGSVTRLKRYYDAHEDIILQTRGKKKGVSSVEKKVVVQAKRSIATIRTWLNNVQ